MNDLFILNMAGELDKLCAEATQEYKLGHANQNVRFCVYQMHDDLIAQITPLDIAKFYNNNWLGNIDYVHIPDCTKVIEDLYKYPLIIAVDTARNEILGAATLRYEEITDDNFSPFFAERLSKKLEITGIITNIDNKNHGCRGIGTQIYELAIKTAYKCKERVKDLRLSCEVDCRNVNSIRALHIAADKAGRDLFKSNPDFGFKTPVIAYYYTIKPDGTLYESTILVIEVKLEPHKIVKTHTPVIEYSIDNRFEQFRDKLTDEEFVANAIYPGLLATIKSVVVPNSNHTVISNLVHELGESTVYYNMLDPEQNQLEKFLDIRTNGTDGFKNRRPYNEAFLKSQYTNFIDPVTSFASPGVLVKKIGWRKTR